MTPDELDVVARSIWELEKANHALRARLAVLEEALAHADEVWCQRCGRQFTLALLSHACPALDDARVDVPSTHVRVKPAPAALDAAKEGP